MELIKYGVTQENLLESFMQSNALNHMILKQKNKYIKLFKDIFRLQAEKKLNILLRISRQMSKRTIYTILLFLDYTNLNRKILLKLTNMYINNLDNIQFDL